MDGVTLPRNRGRPENSIYCEIRRRVREPEVYGCEYKVEAVRVAYEDGVMRVLHGIRLFHDAFFSRDIKKRRFA